MSNDSTSTPPSAGRERIAQVLADAHAAWRGGDRKRAVDMLARFSLQVPAATEILARLGIYALESGDARAACALLQRALARSPDDASTWNNLGTAWLRLANTGEAIAAYRRALSLDPRGFAPQVNLANALQTRGDIDEAVRVLEKVRVEAPDAVEIENNLGNLYKEQGRFEDALAAYLAACRMQSDFRPAHSNLLALLKLSTRHSPDEIFAQHRRFAERFERFWQSRYEPPTNSPDPERRLRLGYVSPDCHTVMPAFLEPVLARHDRARFEVFAYFNNPQPPAMLARLGGPIARSMYGESDDAIARQIRVDGIDVLIDIAGHTGLNRLAVFGQRPAPVQVTWLDYLNTTGLDGIDIRITDPVADPPGASDALHSEALARMPDAQWCWRAPSDNVVPGPLPALTRGALTLGSFNTYAKLTDATLALWSDLLVALPDARLVIVGAPEGHARTRVLAAFARGGAADRVQMHGRLAPRDFRLTFDEVDIALDPLPFSGATTTLEALWRGLPVVTLPGATSASRSTASILSAIGLRDWIAPDRDGYIAIVVRAAASPKAMSVLRDALPGRLRASPLCDAERFTRALEERLRSAWSHWCGAKRASRSGLPAPPAGYAPAQQSAVRRIESDACLAEIDAALAVRSFAQAAEGACTLIDARPEWSLAQRAYIRSLLAWGRNEPGLVARVFPAPDAPARIPKISVIICSIDPGRFRSACASYEQRFAGMPFEIVGIHDARSLADGYNRGAQRADGDLLVFSHDDIELMNPDFAIRMVAHLERVDGVGIAGASKVTGAHWGHAGQRFIHGHVLHPAPENRPGFLLMAAGFQAPVSPHLRLLDGVFIAVRRHVWEDVQFDPERYDGFHGYDLDFTYRASRAGANLAAPADLLLFHRSQGRYGNEWRRYAGRFAEYAELDPDVPPRPGGFQARLEAREDIDLLRAAMVHFRFGAPVNDADPAP